MTRRRMIGTAIALYLVILIISAPATLLDAGLSRASAGQLRLVHAEGTLWHGAGALELRTPRGQRSLIQPANWRLQWRSLLTGRLRFAVALAGQLQPFEVSLRPAGFELHQLILQMPAAILASMDPRLPPLGLAGDLTLDTAKLSISADRVEGSVLLHWRNASSTLSTVSPLGDYQLRLDGDGAAVRLRLQTVQGPLQLDGSGRWIPGRSAAMSATARVPANLHAQLAPILRLVSVEHADGSFALDLDR